VREFDFETGIAGQNITRRDEEACAELGVILERSRQNPGLFLTPFGELPIQELFTACRKPS